ncbi:MAG: Hsp33 family molecular chaperone HslO [Candidatus Scatovivens sp.]
MDRIIKCYALNKNALVTVADTTKLVEKIKNIHDLTPTTSAVLGRVATMATIIAHTSMKDENENITIQINGNGPIGKIICVSKIKGDESEIKIYANNLKVELPLNKNGKLDVGSAVGNDGYLNIIKENKITGKDYNGLVNLVSGEIAEDFAEYYAKSEQKPTVIALGVLVDKDGIRASGGYMINLMPDATEDDIYILEKAINNSDSISKMLEDNKSLEEIAKIVTGDENIEILEDNLKTKYSCDCNSDRIKNSIRMLPKEDIEEIFRDQEKINIKCEFCNKEYNFCKDDIFENL